MTIEIEDYLYEFYEKIGKTAGDVMPAQVMEDALFKLAFELTLEALVNRVEKETPASNPPCPSTE